MSILWERLAGDTSRFAFKVAFHRDPDEGDGATPDEAASWGSFQMWVEGRNLCEHTEVGETIESVHWYLLPLLEWLASNWDALLHEERPPNSNEGDDALATLDATRFAPPAYEHDDERLLGWEGAWSRWWRRHAVLACREGGFFPDIAVRRWRDLIEISWADTPLAGIPKSHRFHFERGVARLDPEIVAKALYDVLRDATAYLVEHRPSSERVRQLHAMAQNIEQTSRTEQRLMWLAGLGTDVSSIEQGWRGLRGAMADLPAEKIQDLFASDAGTLVVRGSCYATLMFGSVAPNVDADDVKTLAGQIIDLSVLEESADPLSDWIGPAALTQESVWNQGYELAEALLDRIGWSSKSQSSMDIQGWVHSMGVEVRELALHDEGIRGLSIAGSRHRPGILLNTQSHYNRTPAGRRFSVAHELCHLLHDRSSGERLAIASGPWAPRDVERRANAFAAMLLMPRALIDRVLEQVGKVESLDDLFAAATALRSSVSATLPHLHNLGYIDSATEERLRTDLLDNRVGSTAA